MRGLMVSTPQPSGVAQGHHRRVKV